MCLYVQGFMLRRTNRYAPHKSAAVSNPSRRHFRYVALGIILLYVCEIVERSQWLLVHGAQQWCGAVKTDQQIFLSVVVPYPDMIGAEHIVPRLPE